MDDSRFDALARRLSDGAPRRPLLGAGLTALAALGTGLAWSGDADARKKKKKKKKKRKKGGGNNNSTTTTKAPVTCPAGERPCNGGCIPDENCCSSSECSSGQQCALGVCLCAAANTISCGESCCNSLTEVCQLDSAGMATCQAGTCQAGDLCAGNGFTLCRNNANGACGCTSTVGPAPQTVCFKFAERDCTQTCTSNADCGSSSVCIPGGPQCQCQTNFCAQLCDI
jgi:hypothetical protein